MPLRFLQDENLEDDSLDLEDENSALQDDDPRGRTL
jgi:hypothetical protein